MQTYSNICVRAFAKCPPKKSKYVKVNNGSLMNKKISKVKMDGARLTNEFLKNRSPENRFVYNQQRMALRVNCSRVQ